MNVTWFQTIYRLIAACGCDVAVDFGVQRENCLLHDYPENLESLRVDLLTMGVHLQLACKCNKEEK
jgi:hypothetical protein